MTADLSFPELARRLAEQAEALCEELLPGGRKIGHEWRCASVAGDPGKSETGGSLAVELRGARRGRWADFANEDEHKGDLLHLVAFNKGLSLGAAAAWARDWLGLAGGPAPGHIRRRGPRPVYRSAPPKDPPGPRSKRDHALRIWRGAAPLAGTLGARYLEARGLSLAPPPTLRFVARLRHARSNTAWPAIVAVVQGPDRAPVGIWRTWLAEDGCAKAPIAPNRMGLGWVPGAALRLGPVQACIGLCEGWENGLAMMQARPGLSVWAGLSANGLRQMVLPPEVTDPRILADWDGPKEDARSRPVGQAGQKAALALKRRLLRECRSPAIVWPPGPGVDLNDVLQGVTA